MFKPKSPTVLRFQSWVRRRAVPPRALALRAVFNSSESLCMRKSLNYGLAVGTLVAAGVLGSVSAKADLIYQGPIDLGGTGLGAVDTILTMTSHGSGTAESGKVSWNGSANVVTADPNPPGYTPAGSTDMTGINHTITMGSTGWVAGDGLGIVFNPAEPGPVGGVANAITLNNLVMTIYGATTGNTLFTAPWLGGPLTLEAVDPGTGNSGYLFTLNQLETTELNNSGVGLTDRIGLLAYATDATGGQETFFGTVIADAPDAVPAPGNTLGLLGVGLVGMVGAVGWNRRRQQLSFGV